MKTLFDEQVERQYGPIYKGSAGHQRTDTSKAAAAAVTPTLASRQIRLIRSLEAHGPSTADEIMLDLGMTDPNQCRPRLTELQALGRIKDSGSRRLTPSGRSAIVWETCK